MKRRKMGLDITQTYITQIIIICKPAENNEF